MTETKYYPLVNMATDGKTKVPMSAVTDKNTVEKNHKFYLEEIIPQYYRLCSSKSNCVLNTQSFDIKCPICGKSLTAISRQVNNKKHSLYLCKVCKFREEQ